MKSKTYHTPGATLEVIDRKRESVITIVRTTSSGKNYSMYELKRRSLKAVPVGHLIFT